MLLRFLATPQAGDTICQWYNINPFTLNRSTIKLARDSWSTLLSSVVLSGSLERLTDLEHWVTCFQVGWLVSGWTGQPTPQGGQDCCSLALWSWWICWRCWSTFSSVWGPSTVFPLNVLDKGTSVSLGGGWIMDWMCVSDLPWWSGMEGSSNLSWKVWGLFSWIGSG